MTHVICRLTAKNQDQFRNPTLGNRVWATFTFTNFGVDRSRRFLYTARTNRLTDATESITAPGHLKSRWVRIVGEISAGLTEGSRELIPETRRSMLEGTIRYMWRRWCRWTSKCDERWRASAPKKLNWNDVMQIWRLGGCENFVGKWEELVFNALGYF